MIQPDLRFLTKSVLFGTLSLPNANCWNESKPQDKDEAIVDNTFKWTPVLIYASIAVTIAFIIVMIIIFQDIRRRHRITSEETDNKSSQDNKKDNELTGSDENLVDAGPQRSSPRDTLQVESTRSDWTTYSSNCLSFSSSFENPKFSPISRTQVLAGDKKIIRIFKIKLLT